MVATKRVDLSYDANSQLTTLQRFEGLGTTQAVAQTTQAHDALGRVTSIQHQTGTTTLAGYTLAWDAASRITQINSVVDGVTNYAQDSTGQLTGEDASGTSSDRTYGYDANGNRNTSGYTTDAGNQTVADGKYTYAYDHEGNRISRTEVATQQITLYQWDYRNRLVGVTQKDSVGVVTQQTTLEYDAFNHWTRRSYDADGAGSGAAVDSIYSFLGEQVALTLDSSGNVQNRYLWGPAVDQLLADEQMAGATAGSPGNVLWALGDQIGTIRDLADYNGATGTTTLANHRQLDAFGNVISETNASVDEFFAGLAGKPFDESIGLQNNLNRWYDPVLGQWLSEDPIEFGGMDGNLRRVVGNRVLSATDPTGLVPPQLSWPTDEDGKPWHPNVILYPNVPIPHVHTGWRNPGFNNPKGYPKDNDLYRGRIDKAGSDYVKFNRDDSIKRYKASGLSEDQCKIAFNNGCYSLTSFRLGRDGKMILAGQPGVGAFQSIESAWKYLLKLHSEGKDARIVVFSSNNPPNFPPDQNPKEPNRNDKQLYDSGKGAMTNRYDFSVLHYDETQGQFYFESQWDGATDLAKGQNWIAAYPLGKMKYDIFLVVEVSKEQAKTVRKLPLLPPELPCIK